MDKCPGNYKYIQNGDQMIKVCDECTFPHKEENYEKIMKLLSNKEKNNKEIF